MTKAELIAELERRKHETSKWRRLADDCDDREGSCLHFGEGTGYSEAIELANKLEETK